MEWTDLYDDPSLSCACPTCNSDVAHIAPCYSDTTENGEERA